MPGQSTLSRQRSSASRPSRQNRGPSPTPCSFPATASHLASTSFASSTSPSSPPPSLKRRASSSPQRPSMLKEAVLGIDMGTTATRTSFQCLSAKGNTSNVPFPVEREGAADNAIHTGDNPALATPFLIHLDPADCLVYTTNTKEITLPLKMVCYVLMAWEYYKEGDKRAVAVIRKTIPQVNNFWSHLMEGKNEFQVVIDHLRNIFSVHLKMIKEASDQAAKRKGFCITRLAVTIPSNWNGRLEAIYEKLIREAWEGIQPKNIYLIYESEAIGHWLLRLDTFMRQQEHFHEFIIGDCGGHTMSTCRFQIARHDNGTFSFYSIRDATSHHGGSEVHTTWVRDEVSRMVKEQFPDLNEEVSAGLIKNLMQNYCEGARTTINGSEFTVSAIVEEPVAEAEVPSRVRTRGHKEQKGKNRNINVVRTELVIPDKVAAQFFQGAFVTPLEPFKKELRDSAVGTKKAAVMLSGRSFLNKNVKNIAVEAINDAGLTFVDWINGGPVAFRTSIVSMGAALAVVNMITVQEFMQKAVFAIDSEGEDNDLPIIFREGKGNWITLDYTKKEVPKGLKIACAPLPPSGHSDHISRFDTYQFWNLGPRKMGRYQVRLTYEHTDAKGEGKHPDHLVLEHKRLNTSKSVRKKAKKIRWPIYYDPGSCVCFLDHDINRENLAAQKKANIFLDYRCRRTLEKWQDAQSDPGSTLWTYKNADGLTVNMNDSQDDEGDDSQDDEGTDSQEDEGTDSQEDEGNDQPGTDTSVITIEDDHEEQTIHVNEEIHVAEQELAEQESPVPKPAEEKSSEEKPAEQRPVQQKPSEQEPCQPAGSSSSTSDDTPETRSQEMAPVAAMSVQEPPKAPGQNSHVTARFTPIIQGYMSTPNNAHATSRKPRPRPVVAYDPFLRYDGIDGKWLR